MQKGLKERKREKIGNFFTISAAVKRLSKICQQSVKCVLPAFSQKLKNLNKMGIECFYGVTLSESAKEQVWDPYGKNPEEIPRSNKLIIKQILLGSEAKDDEFNVVQATTTSLRDQVKIPIAVLKSGETRSIRPELEFPDAPVTFTLIKGNGPVYIHGQHFMGVVDYEELEEMEEESMDEEEAQEDEDEEDEGNPKKKAKLSNNAKGGPPPKSAQAAGKTTNKKK